MGFIGERLSNAAVLASKGDKFQPDPQLAVTRDMAECATAGGSETIDHSKTSDDISRRGNYDHRHC
ncbi:hypothetical protein HB780_12415 (plasmid) [Rhizobium lusitanum]|uniref:hypothetical protein n=1 Tax=Rhizobium lusitanum TaxID=293958 RepID=UPI00161B7B1E|nr:hypothetical protein [Rhizobium lusitanum]QND46433.1 hypothetical protein HB780_12415 [Rhizobium lusitanum]